MQKTNRSLAMLVKLGQRGTITIPKAVRQGLSDDTLFDAVRRDDGVIELRPRTTIDPSQGWFWTEKWQQMERESDEDYAAGHHETFDDAESLLADLEAYATAADAAPEGGNQAPHSAVSQARSEQCQTND
jgi:antitoxin MazE